MLGDFRVRASDASARLAELETKSGRLKLPAFLPVYNPNKPYVSPSEMRRLGAQAIFTNSYIIWRTPHLREVALERGVHGLLGFEGVVFTDSGAYQIYRFGGIEATNLDMLRFQHAIGSDVASIVDVPMASHLPRGEALDGVRATIRSAREWREHRDELQGTLWIGTPQGSTHWDLIEYTAREMAALGFDYYGAGSLKVALEIYDFKVQVDLLLKIRRWLPAGRPIHFWGVGLPSALALFTALGADSFDSASYALFAESGRYMTPHGTLLLDELEEFPCHCPVCSNWTPREVKSLPKAERTSLLSKHNLHVLLSEMRLIREAIRGQWLWELVQERVRAHPRLLEALQWAFSKYRDILEEREPFTKFHGLFYSGPESEHRPEVVRAKRALKRVSAGGRVFEHPIFGEVPIGLRYTYPFGQSIVPGWTEPSASPSDSELISAILQYQFGVDASEAFRSLRLTRSRATGMPRDVYDGETRVGSIRPADGMFVPSLEGASRLVKVLPWPKGRVVVRDEYAEKVARGTTVFVKFVREVDPEVRPGSEVIVVDGSDNVLAVGKALLSAAEYRSFRRHQFIRLRHHSLPRETSGEG